MNDWLILGPISGIDLEKDYLEAAGGESQIEPKEGDKFETEDGQSLTWTRNQSNQDLIDFLAVLGQKENSTAYAFAYIQSPAEGLNAQFLIGKDDGAAVWLGENRVYLNPENSPHIYDDEVFYSELKKGRNRCLVKIFQGFGGWSFSLRALPPSRAEITGQVLDETGHAISSAWVRVEQKGKIIFQRQANAKGHYQLSIYPVKGAYDLTAWTEEAGNWILSRKLNKGDRKRLDIRLQSSISIQGSVLMLDKSSPHVNVVVQALKSNDTHSQSALEQIDQIVSSTLTDNRGHYEFHNLRPGRYQIRCHAQGRLVYYQERQAIQTLKLELGRSYQGINFYVPAFKKGTWRTYTTSQGLAGSKVNHIFKDREGNIWFSTNMGASKFDGTRFVNYHKENGLIDDDVLKIHQSEDGSIWFATRKGLSQLVENNFNHLGTAEGLLDAPLNDFFVDKNGVFWLASGAWDWGNGGVTRYDGSVFQHYRTFEGLISNSVTAIFQDQDDVMWFGTTSGLSRFDGKNFTNFTTKDGLPSNNISKGSINQDNNGNLWIGTLSWLVGGIGGLCQFDGKAFRSISTAEGLHTRNVGPISFTDDGKMWLAGLRNGAVLYDGKSLIHFTENDGLVGDNVTYIMSETDGAVWFATDIGVSRYDNSGLANFTIKDGLIDNVINGIAEDKDGKLYFATNKGLSIYNGNDFMNLTAQDGLPGGSVFGGAVFDVHVTESGSIWLAQGALVEISGSNVISYTEKDGLPHRMIRSIVSDKEENSLWIGTLGGLSNFDLDKKTFTNFTSEDGLPSNFVQHVYQDNDSIWLGLSNPNAYTAISRFSPEQHTITNFTRFDGLPEVKGDWWIGFNVIQRGPNNNLWIGSMNGLSKYDGSNFVTFTSQDGMVSNSINDFLFDTDGLLWLATAEGGVSIHDGESWSSFTELDGLISNNVWRVHSDHLGRLWFATNKGATRYRKRIQKPPVRIIAIQTDYIYTDLEKLPDFNFGERITFKFDTSDFRTLPEKRQYRYRIRELNTDWSESSRTTTFDHKFKYKGRYTFEVQYIDRDLNYSEPASVELTINPPLFYQTIGFLIGVGVIFGIGIVSGTVQTLKMMEQRRRIREYQQLAVEELEEAQGIQMSLMPQSDPDIPGFDITGICVTASEVGGDFFDYIKINQNELGLAVADVSGKQMQGAMNAVMTNGILQLAAQELETDGPSEIMAKMNTILTRRMKNDTNVTMIFGILHSEQKTFNFCNAAHHAHPILCRDGQVETITSSGFPLGMKPDITYPLYQVQLQKGDAIILMSDGIIESIDEDGVMYAETNKMEKLLQGVTADTPASEIRDRLVNDAIQHGADEDLRDDDITVIVIRMV